MRNTVVGAQLKKRRRKIYLQHLPIPFESYGPFFDVVKVTHA